MTSPHRPWRRRLLVVTAVVLAVALPLYLLRGTLALRLAERQIDQVARLADPLAALPDGLHVGLCGTGSPMVDARHGGPCTVVIAGRRMLVFDAGPGSAAVLTRMRLNPGQIEAVYLTHFHSDHIGGLPDVLLQRWVAASARQPLPIVGPPGVAGVVDGLTRAFAADHAYRVQHHGTAIVPPAGGRGEAREFTLGPDGRAILINDGALQLVAFEVDHGPVKPAVGYRIEYRGRTVVLSGDTRASAAVERESQGVDLLIHEGLSPQLVSLMESSFAKHARLAYARVMADIRNYHTAPTEAAAIAARAGVKMLVFNHIVPPLPVDALEPVFLGDARRRFDGPIRVGADGDWFTLPANSTAIVEQR